MANIKLYTTDYCPYCQMAKQLLQQREVEFEEIYVSRDDQKTRTDLYRQSGMKTMPQIFSGEQLIGGYTELSELDKKDMLSSLK